MIKYEGLRLKIRTAPDAPVKALPKIPFTYNELIELIKEKFSGLKLLENDTFVITY